jgi:hypothetical protein
MKREDDSSLEDRYRGMSEPDLLDLARQYDNLSPTAQTLLRAEFDRRSLDPPLLEDPEDEPRDASGTLVTVERYRDLSEAFVARSVLQSAGIPCFLCDENFVRLDWGYSNFIGGMRLQVASKDADDAFALLHERPPDTIDVPGEPTFVQPVCPRCGSEDVVAHDAGLKTAAFGALIGLPTRISANRADREAWHCMNCSLTWEDTGEAESQAAANPVR